ncbi:hypothetical protein [Flavobacterium sp.]|uniref:hypothetical protein n=1 Tax=Flavobacterium sp. TaxID=239 RepID=UPI002A83FA74|nr:hypothetical protein [Flavobacterium sp.]
MKNYIYLEKVSLLKNIIGNLFLILGLSCLIFINNSKQPNFILLWVFFLFIGAFLISTEGIEIDFKKNTYRKVLSMYGINYGLSWDYFPKIEYISLLETKVKQKIGGLTFRSTATATFVEKVVKINLFNENNRPQTIYYANNIKEALIISEQIKAAYNVEIKRNF